jgi:hypothetical protein
MPIAVSAGSEVKSEAINRDHRRSRLSFSEGAQSAACSPRTAGTAGRASRPPYPSVESTGRFG